MLRFCLLVVCVVGLVQALPAREKDEEVALLSRLVDTLKAMAAERKEKVAKSDEDSAEADFQEDMEHIFDHVNGTCSEKVTDAIAAMPSEFVTRDDIIKSLGELLRRIDDYHDTTEVGLDNFLEMQSHYWCEYSVVHAILLRLHYFGEEGVGVCTDDLDFEYEPDFACCPAVLHYIDMFRYEFRDQLAFVVIEEEGFLHNLTLPELCGGFALIDWMVHMLSDVIDFAGSGWCGFEFGPGGDSNSDSDSGEKKQIGQAKRRISEAETVKIHQEIASKFGASGMADKRRRELHPIMLKKKTSAWQQD